MDGLFSEIEALVQAAKGIGSEVDAKICLALFPALEKCLSDYYSAQNEPDFRISKILSNLHHYVRHYSADDAFACALLAAIATTLQRIADYDLNIRDFPEKVKTRNESILEKCDKLRHVPKEPLEESSDKAYDVTIFLATYNQLELTKLCLASIYNNTNDVSCEIFLIDNGSSDGTYEFFASDSRIKIIRLVENVGLLPALHIFYEAGLDNGKFWLYMNNDVIVTPRWLSNMLKAISSDPAIGAVMPTTNRAARFLTINMPPGLYEMEEVQSFGENYNVSNPALWQDWLIMYGFVCLVRPSARRILGYYEDCFYFPYYYSDGDVIVLTVKAGYRAVQCRDTYVHHFDGGHTNMQNRRGTLAEGEYSFYKKYGYFPTDYEVDYLDFITHLMEERPLNILFLGSARGHILYKTLNLHKKTGNTQSSYYAADTMEKLSAEQISTQAQFAKLNSWYELESVFPGVKFDIIIFMENILHLRRPERFLKAVNERLTVNGRLFFELKNTGYLHILNYIIMERRSSPRDACRLRKILMPGLDEIVQLVHASGMVINDINKVYLHELFNYTNISTIENYRTLVEPEAMAKFENNIRHNLSIVCARKGTIVNTEKSMEQLLLKEKQ